MTARRLANWAAGLDLDDIPEVTRRAALRHLLDGIGNAIGARRLDQGGPGLSVARGLGGPPQAHPLGDPEAISAPAAAFANGVLMHALDFDDTHAGALVHPTTVVAPAVLAVAEEVGATGAQTVTALVAGLEIACRLGAAAPHGFHTRGLHATAVVGPLAGAVAAGLLYGADADRLTDAIGVAASSSGGLLEFLDTGANTKVLHPGNAGFSGVLAARLALAGASGPESVLEGRRGLYRALADRDVDPDVIVADLGTRWESAGIGIKPYPSCQLMHASLDAVAQALAEAARSGTEVPASRIAAISVDVHPDSVDIVCGPGTGSRSPRSVYDAKFDLPWSVAALVHDGAVTVDTYADDSIVRPEVAATAGLVEVVPVPDDRPAADAAGRAVITLDDSTRFVGEVPCSRGTSGRPMDDAAVAEKFRGNSGGGETSDALVRTVFGLCDAPSVAPIAGLAADILAAG
ncbi:MmgE/PrpD family protein [Gordonia rubripertincta]|uniref:MmgE/PrpD family protein n=1 Tax=Gordonia rubripertincta TaxID=36822 RepID=UPI0015F9C6E5|nr:MmgE/PrpD family protein [Gordonia rubripertincta]QMU21823.1 MmgE/PrpD family protein [Gordonia rubripertincta]